MNLREYLETNGIKMTAFAKRVKVSSNTLFKVIRGSDMHLSTAYKIMETTKGDVSFQDLYYSIKSIHGNNGENPCKNENKNKKKRTCK